MKLSKADLRILNSYVPVVQGLGDYLSDYYEVVLHSLEDLEHSVICIVHGEHTGRAVGAPITDRALIMLRQISEGETDHVVYFSQNNKGEPLKSTTIAIRGKAGRVIGLLCMNLYLNAPLSEVIASLSNDGMSMFSAMQEERYAQNASDLITSTVRTERATVLADTSISPSNKNRRIVERLYDRGIFQLKDAVVTVARMLGISKNTVYKHLRGYKHIEMDR